MSYPVNVPIVCTATATTLDGQEPIGVELQVKDPNGVTVSVSIAQTFPRVGGSWNYRGYFVPHIAGDWTRTWSGSNLLTDSVVHLTVV